MYIPDFSHDSDIRFGFLPDDSMKKTLTSRTMKTTHPRIRRYVEVGQTKVSLPMLLRISHALQKEVDYFLLDTPYANRDTIINSEISNKLKRCNASTLVTVNSILDALLDHQSHQHTDTYH